MIDETNVAEDELDHENGAANSNAEKRRKKEERSKIAKHALLQSLYSGKAESVSERVALVLKLNTKARNNEIELYKDYWTTFESENLSSNQGVNFEEFLKITRPMTLTRMRAKIQNEFHLFEADDTIKKRRGVLSEEKRSEMLDMQASFPVFSVFADESGKTSGEYLIIGSLWFADARSEIQTIQRIRAWKTESKINHEFHFAELSPNQLEEYKAFIDLLLTDNHTLSFKAAIVKKSGIKNTHNALFHLSLFLLREGILHENSTGNAKLPRRIEVSFDSENPEADKLRLSTIKTLLHSEINDVENRLRCESFEPVDSKGNHLIQSADLFAASLNRKLNERPGKLNHKDALADHLFQKLGIIQYAAPNVGFENNAVKIFSLSTINSDDIIVT